jgi:subtilisin-like proprotein convertase family protein
VLDCRVLKTPSRLCLVTCSVVAAVAFHFPIRAQSQPEAPPLAKTTDAPANFDIRVSAPLRSALLQRLGREPQPMTAGLARAHVAPDATNAGTSNTVAAFSPFTGGAEVVRRPRGALTEPASDTSAAIVTSFLRAHPELYGLSAADVGALRFRGESVSRGSGLRMLRAEQTVNGIPVFQSDARFVLDREGRLIRTIGALVPASAADGAAAAALSAGDALITATQSVGITLTPALVTSGAVQGDRQTLHVASDYLAGPVTSRLVYFAAAPGVLLRAWEQVIFTDGDADWLTVTDASSGALLWRKNLRAYASTQQARFSVYVQADGVTPADSPAPSSPTTATVGSGTQPPAIARTIVEMLTAQDITASPNGWVSDGGETTTGNNVDACVDRVGGANANLCDSDANSFDASSRPIGNPDGNGRNRDFLGSSPRDFDYTPPPSAGNPEAGQTATGNGAPFIAFRRGAVTQVFYVANWFHDRLFNLGFDEAAGNFQQTNFSGMGLGNDRVLADIQDSSGTNNFSFSTPPDGTSGRMQMFRFTGPTIDRDGALDTGLVIHELAHGLTSRLVGNGTGLIWSPGAALGEGWSDFYALALLNNTNADDPNGVYAHAPYASYKLITNYTDNYVYGNRRFPYTTDNAINPLTWADVDDVTTDFGGGMPISPLGLEHRGSLEQTNAGELWALTLWEVRSRIIADPNGAAGDVPTGNATMLQLVTDALKLTPVNPSFVDARDALIDADCATNACANERSIWEGFADRGLGYGAVSPLGQNGYSPGHMGLGPSDALPHLDVAGVTLDDSFGNNNGALDPGEPALLTVSLKNPWAEVAGSVASASASLTTSTPGVTIVDATSAWPAIAAGAVAAGDTFRIHAGSGLTCGQSIRFSLQVTSSQGTVTVPISLRIGLRSGTDAPVTYTKTVSPGLGIPAFLPRGVTDTLTITDDFEIADLDFRLDNLTHTFPGDVNLVLRAPNGYGPELIAWLGGLTDGGPGDNFINTVIDDEATGDLLNVTAASAPYTASWLPIFNAPSWTLAGFGSPDPVGPLSRLDGQSTAGTWTVLVADNFAGDSGTLNAWSLIVTPAAFTCTLFVDSTPPVTTTTLTPPAPNGSAGWYVSPVQAVVAATDFSSVIAETRCVLDPLAPPAAFADLPAGCGFTGAGASITGDGVHQLFAASLDSSNNTETPSASTVRIDATPPALTCVAPAPVFALNQAGAAVSATVTDATSGPSTPTASAAANITTAGAHTVTIMSADVAGNVGSVVCNYSVDATPPVTTTTLTPSAPNGSAGWYVSPVQAVVAATDSGSLVAETRCVLDPLAAPVTFANLPPGCGFTGAGASITADGVHQLFAASIDSSSNAETPTGSIVRIDATPPTLTCATPAPVFAQNQAGAVVTATVTDATSGPSTPTTSAAANTTTAGAHTVTIMSADVAGNAGSVVCNYSVDATPTSPLTYILTEGSTGSFFGMDVALANPNPSPAHVTVTFLTNEGTTVVQDRILPATSRTTIRVNDVDGLAATSVSVIVSSLDRLPLGVERSMFWDSTSYAGHSGNAVTDARTRWMFAEGSQGFFHTYLLIVNPAQTPTTATVTLLPEAGGAVTRAYPMPAMSRRVIDVGAIPEAADRSFAITVEAGTPIAVERSMYFGDSEVFAGGHVSAGAADPSTTWLFAEGATGAFFDSYILLANPGATPANVTLTFLLDSGATVVRSKVVEPMSRLTVGIDSEDPLLAAAAMSTQVGSDVPIVAERSTYWSTRPGGWTEGHNTLGVTAPRTRWVLAEGRVGGPLGFQTYILLGNPTTEAANVTITYLKSDGTTVMGAYVVPPHSRSSVLVNAQVPELVDESFGALVQTNNVGIVVERSLYWNAGGVVWAGGSNVGATPVP